MLACLSFLLLSWFLVYQMLISVKLVHQSFLQPVVNSSLLLLSTAKCPKGMYKSSTTDCSPCPVGTFNDQQGQTQCSQKCPPGTSSLPGAKSALECESKLQRLLKWERCSQRSFGHRHESRPMGEIGM